MRRIFTCVAPVVAAGLLAACAGGTPSSIPATTVASSASRTALDKVKAATASPAQLTFASPTAAAQNETISFQTGDINHVTVTIAPANLVTVATCQTTTTTRGKSGHGDDDDRDRDDGGDRDGGNHVGNCGADSHTLVYTVTPKTAGTGTITITAKNGDGDDNHTTPVVVPVTVAGGFGPLVVNVTPAGNLITCLGSLTAPTCPGTSLPLLNALAATPQLPQFTLAITETNYTGVFTVTDLDTSCGIAPATSRTPTTGGSETVQIALTQAGFSTIQAIRASPPLSAATCNVVVADDHGGSQTVTLSWQLGSDTLPNAGGV